MTDWLGGRGQGKWLTNAVTRWCGGMVMQWCGDMVVGGKANDSLVWWQGARQMTDWLGGRGQGKWLTGLVAGDKANDWLMRWHGDAVMRWCGDAVTQWCSDAVVGGKANDWLVWWQGARQMTDWFGGRGQGKCMTNAVMQWCRMRW